MGSVQSARRKTNNKFVMVAFIVFTLAVLSTAVGQSFTAFHSEQVDGVHDKGNIQPAELKEPKPEDLERKARNQGSQFQFIPEQPSFGPNIPGPQRFGQNIPSFHSSGFPKIPLQQQRRNGPGPIGSPERNSVLISKGNIVDQTKEFVNSAKTLFGFLNNNEQARLTIDIVFETSDCLRNVTDVIALMDEPVKLVEENAPEIIYLEAIIENLQNEKDINEQIEASAKMLRTLGHLIPNLSYPSPRFCVTNPEDSVRAFKSLAHAMIDIRNHREIAVDGTARQY